MGTWAIKLDLIRDWLDEQDSETAACIKMALEVLKDRGPALGRPLVDTVSYSKYGNMKELRPASPGESEIRILFAFDPARRAVMLLAGDKAKGTSRLRMEPVVSQGGAGGGKAFRAAPGRRRGSVDGSHDGRLFR